MELSYQNSTFDGVRALVCDLDGTLCDSMDLITDVKEQVFKELHIKPCDRDLIASTNLMHLRDSFVVCTGMSLSSLWEEAEKLYWRLLRRESLRRLPLMPGVVATLETLRRRGVKIGVMSTRSTADMREILAHLGLSRLVDASIGYGDDGVQPKPAPDMVEVLLDRMRVAPSQAVTIGDTGWDVEMGRAAGTGTIAAVFWPGTGRVLASYRPDAVVFAFDEVLGLINP